MSVLEDILGKVAEKALGGDEKGGSDKEKLIAVLLPIVISMLADGGLEKILGKMRKQGLSAEADSWVSKGDNKPISPEQAQEVVGSDKVKQIAERVGVSEDQAAKLVAEALPQVVDEVSPQGSEPLADEVGKALDSLSG